MYCPNCGTELPKNVPVCPSCGASVPGNVNTAETGGGFPTAGNEQNVPVFTGFETLKRVFSSSLFLVICIFLSAVAAFSLMNESFDLFAILGAIACWIYMPTQNPRKNP